MGQGLIMRRHNLGTVISFEVIRTLTKKRFWVGTLLVPVAIAVVIALNVVSNNVTSESLASQKYAKFHFSYIDESGYVNPIIAAAIGGKVIAERETAIAAVKSGELDAFFHFPKDPTSDAIRTYGKDSGIFNNGKYSAVAGEILRLSAQSALKDKTLSSLASNKFKIQSDTFKDGKESGNLGDAIPPLLFLLIFYLVILLLGNQMLTSTQEEKENRVTEIILTTLNPTTLIMGKIISLFIIGLAQIAIFTFPVVAGYAFFRKDLHLPNFDFSTLNFSMRPMTIALLLLIAGFTLFTATLVAVGAIMPTAKEAGQIFGVVVTLLFIPFWIASLIASDPSALIVQVFTYFPYSAPVTAMMRNGLGSLSNLQATLVIAELFILGVLVLRFAVRLFRYGSMEYTKRVSVLTIFAKK